MIYTIYEMQQAALAPMRILADATQSVFRNPWIPLSYTRFGKSMAAGAEVLDGVIKNRDKPEWRLDSTEIDGKKIAVTQEVALAQPFGDLLHFKRDIKGRKDPQVLLVAPMSGHYASLLRGTVSALLPGHDVYITDWHDARDVPLSAGRFNLDDYVEYVCSFLRHLGPDTHVIAVCQPAPMVLAAVSLLAAAKDKAQPRTMTLMGGPVDPRANPTLVTQVAENRPLSWFESNVVDKVPVYYPGSGRRVYPGFMQLSAFISMNPGRHFSAHVDMFKHLVQGDGDSADAHRRFYDEYLTVQDISADFYLDTVDKVFQRHLLPKGELTWRDQKVDPSAITETALLTIEGELDDISAPGQTLAAHALCSNLAKSKQEHYLQKGVGHYGIFNGRRWREQIMPTISAFMHKHA
ncbi:MAG: polyhydroxyalkanoate depolymerase [Alphaproteobacteria bacterium]|nr:polyhydroxyalkanoate depolymerase [Alphaproteobacteria bacterium]MBU0798996.1 polyhydroxyalkanoate depolymerase [Alphaproteobacteria bacterium]MBU0887735.1 polyhydroxyalkanoate depolymerase [Alphaproteobacteria bacterium]MBU1815042.1 polyhydroxyalkanoate depolymerase [Alphaproteobacteria bacterium]